MNTLIDEVFLKLDEKYSKEKIEYIYNHFFYAMRDVFKGRLAASVYISNFGSFFLSGSLIQKKIERYKRMKLDTTELDKLLDLSSSYKTNEKWKLLSKKEQEKIQ